jgi:hypothetical protein
MRGVAVFGYVEWVGHGVVLGLQSDLDDFHGCDDDDGFSDSGGETGWVVLVEFGDMIPLRAQMKPYGCSILASK